MQVEELVAVEGEVELLPGLPLRAAEPIPAAGAEEEVGVVTRPTDLSPVDEVRAAEAAVAVAGKVVGKVGGAVEEVGEPAAVWRHKYNF